MPRVKVFRFLTHISATVVLFCGTYSAKATGPVVNQVDSTYNSLLVDFLRFSAPAPAIQCGDQDYPIFGVDVKVYNLGPQVNSKYSDYNPVLDKKETFMLFTTRRQTDMSEPKDMDGQYYEKMFVSRKDGGVFGQAHPITQDDSIFGRLPSSERHESLIFLSYSEDLLITYADERLYYSNRIGKFYTEPVEFPKVINKGKWKRHASITEDGRTLYFTTESVSKVSKNLNLDIWEIKRNRDGSWQKPNRLTDVINTPYNEDSPEISPDGRFLFFSSNRAGGIGGYDVYMAEKVNGKWQEPKNLCNPINTPGDDIYFKLSRNGNYAYYSSNALGGQGNMDIYKVVLDVPSIATCGSYSYGRRSITFTSPFSIDFYGKGTEFFWSFGDGQSDVGTEVTHQYTSDGDYTVVLYVRDKRSKRVVNTVFSKKVRVDTENSAVEIAGPDTVELGNEVLFDGQGSYVDNEPATAYYWKVDGQLVSREPVVNYKFTGVGNHKVELEVGVLDERVMELSSSCIAREIEVVTPFVYQQTVGAKEGSEGFSFTPLIPDQVLFDLGVEEESDPLNLQNDYVQTWASKKKSFSVFENDRSPGIALDRMVFASKAKYGTVKVTNAPYGIVEYTPAAGFYGYDKFTYTAKAKDGSVSSATVVVNVMKRDEVMEEQDVNNDEYEVKKGEEKTIYPLENDVHRLGSKQKLVSVTQPSSGSVEQLGLQGLLKYTPNASYQGNDAFTYTVEDEQGAKNTASVIIRSKEIISDDLFANPDYVEITEDQKTRLRVLENDVIKGGAKIVDLSKSAHGQVKLINPNSGDIYYGPDQGFIGTDAFTYTLENDKGVKTTTSVTVVVKKRINLNKPLAVETYQFNPINVFVFDELDIPASYRIASPPQAQHGTAGIVDGKKGIITYRPEGDYTGYDLFFLDLKNGDEQVKVGLVVKILEQSGLISKYGVANNSMSINSTGKSVIDPFFEYQKLGENPQILRLSGAQDVASIAGEDQINFDYSQLDKEQFALAYQVKGDGGDLNASALLINPVDEIGIPLITRMVLSPDMGKTKVNEPFTLSPLENDRHLKGERMKVVSVSEPLNGTIVFKEADGTVMYIPNLDFNGTDAFTYTVEDESGTRASTAANMVVLTEVQYKLENEGYNPKLKAFKYATLEPDKSFMSPEKVVDATAGLFGKVEVTNPLTGEISYTPNEGFEGVDRFSFTMLHKDGSYSTHPVMAAVDTRNEFFEGERESSERLFGFNDEIMMFYPLINKRHPQGKDMRVLSISSEKGGVTDIMNETAFTYKAISGYTGLDRLTYKVIDENGKIQVNYAYVNVMDESMRNDIGLIELETPVNVPLTISLREKATGYQYIDHTEPESGTLELVSERNLLFEYKAALETQDDIFTVSFKSSQNIPSYVTVSIDVIKAVDFVMNRKDFADFGYQFLQGEDKEVLGVAESDKGMFRYDYSSKNFTYEPYADATGYDRLEYVVKTDSGPETRRVNAYHHDYDKLTPDREDYYSIKSNDEGKLLIYLFSNMEDRNAAGVFIDKLKKAEEGEVKVLDEELGIIEYTPAQGVVKDYFTVIVEDRNKNSEELTFELDIEDVESVTPKMDEKISLNAAANMKAFNYQLIDYLEEEKLQLVGVSGGANGAIDILDFKSGLFTYLPKEGFEGVDYLLVEVQDESGMRFTIPVEVGVKREEEISAANLTYGNVASVQKDRVSYHTVLGDNQDQNRLIKTYGAKAGTVEMLDAKKGIVKYTPFDGFVGEDSYSFEYANEEGELIQKEMHVFIRDESVGVISMSEIKRQSELIVSKETNISKVLADATEQSQAEAEPERIDIASIQKQQSNQQLSSFEQQARSEAEKKAKLLAQQQAAQEEKERLAREAKEQKRAEELAAQKAQEVKEAKAADLAAKQKAEQDRLANLEADQAAKEKAEARAEAEANAQAKADKEARLQEEQRLAEERMKAQKELAQQDKSDKLKAPASPQKDDDVVVFRNILFDFDKSNLRPLSEDELNKVYNYLIAHPEKILQLDGHADWIGTVEYNLGLSERRAKRAYEYLLEKGMPETRIVYQYFGEAVPVAPNVNPDGSDNPDGRQLNRRCEFNIKSEGTADIIMKF